MTTAGLTNYLQTSLSSCSYILFLKVEKINTHIQTLLTSYFSNLTSSLLLHHENASKKITSVIKMAIFTYICMLCFPSIVSTGPQECRLV